MKRIFSDALFFYFRHDYSGVNTVIKLLADNLSVCIKFGIFQSIKAPHSAFRFNNCDYMIKLHS